ncbi:MAG: hypothetical protein ACD_75C01609G0015 [uncultured bacterium]|nr:MAG: hypothetical protein ACD_75C01609G0015 [uncultured bacterium]
MTIYEETASGLWEVPYLTIDPADVGRTYESIIRINSQSGKGGVAYVMDKEFGFKLPREMHPEFGAIIQDLSEREGRELQPQEIYSTFEQVYLSAVRPFELKGFNVIKRHFGTADKISFADVEITLLVEGQERIIRASGNGPLDAFCSAMKASVTGDFTLCNYHEHALNGGSSATAAAYIEIEDAGGNRFWGVGIDTDIIVASIKAVMSALNRSCQK